MMISKLLLLKLDNELGQPNRMKSEIGYSILSSGDARFIRELPIPLASNLELIAEGTGLKYRQLPEDNVFSVDTRPMAVSAEAAAAVGVLFFAGSWLVSKLLDEIYDIKLKPIIRNVIQKADEIVIFGDREKILSRVHREKILSFVLGIYHEDKEKLVIVVLKTNEKSELLGNLEMIKNVHMTALQNLEKAKCELPVHLYIIQDGRVNLDPIKLHNIHEAIMGIYT